MGFLSKQVEEYERETQVLSAKNGHLEKQLMAFEQKEKETLKMTTQEVRLYERVSAPPSHSSEKPQFVA